MDFNKQSIITILLGTFSIAAVHALIPSHWLSFAVVGRKQRWTMRQTLTITILAGIGHVLLTVILGFVLVVVGKEMFRAIPAWAEHAATATVLIALGLWFALSGLRPGHTGCSHEASNHEASNHGDSNHEASNHEASNHGDSNHEASNHEASNHGDSNHEAQSEGSAAPVARLGSTPTAMGALVLGMTLSPCLDLLSVYVGASALPWHTLVAISLIMSGTTLAIMVLLVWLTIQGLQRLNLGWLERHEGLAIGSVLIALGVLLLFL